jgi:hypothetical protein
MVHAALSLEILKTHRVYSLVGLPKHINQWIVLPNIELVLLLWTNEVCGLVVSESL